MKVSNINEAITLIEPGNIVTFGGNTLHRVPVSAVKEIIEQKKTITVVKTAGSLEVDALCAAGLVEEVIFSYIGYEDFGLAPFFCQSIEQGNLKATEHTTPSLLAGLKAAAQGISFMPFANLGASEIPKINKWREIQDPYTGEFYLAIPAIRPDWAILHVQQADVLGNARIFGSKFDDVLLARAARHVIITCEEILPAYAFTDQPESTDIPGFMVDKVVYAPQGAWPTSCYQHYSLDDSMMEKIVSYRLAEDLLEWFSSLPKANLTSPLLGSPLAQQELNKMSTRRVVYEK